MPPAPARPPSRAHARIFEAIAAHDPVEAELAMQEHLDAVVKLYWQMKREEMRER